MFTANDICKMNGWTRGQLEQANSRIGFGDFIGRPENGKARVYGRGLAIMFAVVARLRSMRMDWKDIRDVLVGDDVLFRSFLKDRTLFDEHLAAANGNAVLFVVFQGLNSPDGINLLPAGVSADQFRGAFVVDDFGTSLAEWMADPKTENPVAMVVSAERIIRDIDLAVTIKNAVEPQED